MPPAVSGLLNKGSRTFGSFTAGQKVVSIIGALVLVFGGYFFMTWASKPTYAPLFTNVSPTDASAIVDQLNSAGTPYKLTDGGGTILVPQSQVYDTRIALSGKGVAPTGSSTGWGLLDKQGITTSKFQQTVAYQRALEGELAKTIGGIDGVNAAVVHLALPEKTVFSKQTEPAKAAVFVSTAPGRNLTSGQVQAVINLVSSSVENMDPANVTVADSTGKVLSSSDANGGAGADTRSEQTHDFEVRKAADLQAMVEKVVGPGHSQVQVTALLDFDRTKTTSETYTDPNVKPSASSKTSETFTGSGGTPVGGVLGPDNGGVPSTGTANSNGNYTKTNEDTTNALNRTVEERVAAPGTPTKLSVAVLLDAKTAGDTAQVQQIKDLVSSAAGIDAKRGDTVVVNALPFDETAAKTAADELSAAKKADAAAARNTMIFTAAKYLGGGILLLLLFFFTRKKLAKLSRVAEDRREIEVLQAALAQQQLETAQMNAVGALPGQRAGELGAGPAVEARSDVGDMVKSQPDEVAQLLRGWLADRRS